MTPPIYRRVYVGIRWGPPPKPSLGDCAPHLETGCGVFHFRGTILSTQDTERPIGMQSDAIKKGISRAPARAMLKATGLTDADLAKPLVAVANTWTEVTPCNFHLRALAEKVKEGIRAAGGTPIEFDTITISDGITMGTEGMKASLVSREVIADSIELFVRAHAFDAVVALCGCDKTIPGTVMALARLNLPSLSLYGGSIMPGRFHGHDVTIQDVFEAVGACAAGKMTEKELGELEDRACPGAGACGGQFTANTMATAITFLGISPMGANEVPAVDPRKAQVAFDCGTLVMELLNADIRPAQSHHPRRASQRHRVGGGYGRLDQRGAAPAGHRARRRRAADHRRIRQNFREDSHADGPQARRAIHCPRICTPRAACACSENI